MFESLGKLTVAQEIEQQYAELFLEFLDVIRPPMEARRKLQGRCPLRFDP